MTKASAAVVLAVALAPRRVTAAALSDLAGWALDYGVARVLAAVESDPGLLWLRNANPHGPTFGAAFRRIRRGRLEP